jgi:hypothetical protein
VDFDLLPESATYASTSEVRSHAYPGPAQPGPAAEDLRLLSAKPDALAIQHSHKPQRPAPAREHPPLVDQQGRGVHILSWRKRVKPLHQLGRISVLE